MARIGQILVVQGATSENNVARALGVQGFAGGRLGTLLLERGSISEDELGEALSQQHGRPYVPWTVLGEVPPDVIASLPAKFAIRHAAVPFERGENSLKIALRDPGDLRILDELFFVTGRKIISAVAPEARIYHALEKYYGDSRSPRYAILGEKLARPTSRRKTRSSGPPPPPDFFPSGQKPAPPPQPHELWAESPDGETAAPPIIQRWKVPDAPAAPWTAQRPTRPRKVEPEPPPEEESISWEETPPPEMWLPPGAVTSQAETPAPPPAPAAPPPRPPPPPAAPFPAPVVAAPEAEARVEKAPELPAPLPPPAPIVIPAPAPAPPQPATPAVAVAPPTPAAEYAFGAAAEAARAIPSEADFPEVLGANTRDGVAAAALLALVQRFGRGAFLVARPGEVVGHSAAGPGINREAFRAISIPWSEPSVFLNVRLSRAFYLGPLPPLPRHKPLLEALGGSPEECLVQPVMMKDKPVAFLYAEFGHDRGASPMDLAYMRGLAAAAARALAASIRQKRREPV